MGETRKRHVEETKGTYILSRYLWDKLQFGTLWKAYIPAMTYDLLHSSIRSSNSKAQDALLTVTGNFPSILSDRHPCRRGIFVVYGRQFDKLLNVQHRKDSVYFLTADYRICGVYNFTYDPSYYIDEPSPGLSDRHLPCPDDKPLRISWNLQAGEGFRINFTLSEFTAPRLLRCADARVVIHREAMLPVHPVEICPKSGKVNVVSKHLMVTFVLHYYQNPLFIDKRDQKYTKLTFNYQILDVTNVSVFHTANPPRRQLIKLGRERTLQLEPFNGTFLNGSNPGFVYMLKLPYASVYAFAIIIHGLLTPVIYRNNFTCNIPEAEAIFYDGPVQTRSQPALPILRYWSCSQKGINNMTNHDDEEVRGSIGELNIVFFVPNMEENGSIHLEITWQAKRMLPSALRIRDVDLKFLESTMIEFHPATTTLFDVVHVQAPESKFIQLSFMDIYYAESSEAHANVNFDYCRDGFRITGHHTMGTICSNSTAENLLNHYKTEGFVVGQKVTLMRKQYAWLLPMSEVIIVRSHSCAGYVNVFPTRKRMFKFYRLQQAIVAFDESENDTFAFASDVRIIFFQMFISSML